MTTKPGSLQARLRVKAGSLPLDAKRILARIHGIESWYPHWAGFAKGFARNGSLLWPAHPVKIIL